ncbi:hypothetical protein CROQUDRAFT_61959 [Cronartium quercuum f. sp. fusiforme G11]|uniref:Laccase n=1 Tax=Cronartium quercuum f. sp. fusiforme G11 TaxID=708437 RepID=A0A9P6TCF1_9BASI|nr:hypothetical protein CROQUDRAFT_61959 [Cronartium quercuum f. sp. fusiforme G11]
MAWLRLCLLALGSFAVRAAEVNIYWNITYATGNPDGLFERTVIGVNNTWPPPPITVQAGDVIRMHAYNGLGDTPTTLHFHGMFFNRSNFYDGAMGVTQCGIPPGKEFVYVVDTTTQVGTYWVHAHSLGQYVDGLRAPVVILPAQSSTLPAYTDEYTIVLSDWYHSKHSDLMTTFMSKSNPTGAEPIPDSAAIYITHNSSYLPNFNENSTIPFVPGRTYRLRIINMGAFGMFYFKIDGHKMSVIEVDGTDVQPFAIDSLSLSVAQRYSVLVTARNDTRSNWHMHANYDSDMFDSVPDKLVLNYTSSIIYEPTAPMAPDEPFSSYDMTNDTAFQPKIVQRILKPTRPIELNAFFATFDNGINRGAFNNVTFVPPLVPTAMTVDSAPTDSLTNPSIYGPQSNVYLVENLDVVELKVLNWDAGNHPFHLHGHKFQIVGKRMDMSNPNEDHAIDENQANPMRRDTIQIPGGGSVTLRFVADSPGSWFFHCHIEWHLESGLAALIVVAPLISQQSIPVPQFMKDHCTALGKPSSGNAGGLSGPSIYDLSKAPHGPYPQRPGFHAKGKISIAGCILASLIGVATIIWYATGEQFEEAEVERELKVKLASKAAKRKALIATRRKLVHLVGMGPHRNQESL